MNQYINFLKGLAAFCVFSLHFCLNFRAAQYDFPTILFTPAWTGVWIFFIVAGYLTGKGFYGGKYKTENKEDFLNFYLKRIIRIFPIYFLILIIDILFVNTDLFFNGSEMLARTFTFRIRVPYVDGMIGNAWFISTLVQMYLITPFVWKFLINPVKKQKHAGIFTALLMIFLLIIYLMLRLHLWERINWSYYIFPNIITNLDLFFCGFLFNQFTQNSQDNLVKKFLRPFALVLLISFIIINTYYMHELLIGFVKYNLFLRIICPTIIIIILLPSLYAYNIDSECYKLKIKSIIKNPLLILNYLGIISFGFFICHNQIMYNVKRIFHFTQDQHILLNIFNLFNIKINMSAQTQYIWAVFFTSIIFTLIWAIVLHYMLEIPTSKIKIQIPKKEKD